MLEIKISLTETTKIIKYFKNSNLDRGDGSGSRIITLYAQDLNWFLEPMSKVQGVHT